MALSAGRRYPASACSQGLNPKGPVGALGLGHDPGDLHACSRGSRLVLFGFGWSRSPDSSQVSSLGAAVAAGPMGVAGRSRGQWPERDGAEAVHLCCSEALAEPGPGWWPLCSVGPWLLVQLEQAPCRSSWALVVWSQHVLPENGDAGSAAPSTVMKCSGH